jgi:hypothetical protein
VLTYFDVPHPREVYFRTAEEQLRRLRPGDALLRRLAEPPWRQAFSDYRNVLTHELLLATRFDIRCTMEGAAARRTIVIPLPDDPRVDPPGRTYNQNADVLEYSGTCFKRIVTCINVIYGDVVARATAANSLPI